MSWRAFAIGLLAIVVVCLVEVYSGVVHPYGSITGTTLPAAAVLVLVLLTVGLNPLIGLVRRGWAFRRAELMVVYAMVLCACVVPGDGLGAFWYSVLAGGPYMARRADLHWEDTGSLTVISEDLVLSKDPKSVAALQYFEGTREGRVPWRMWVRPIVAWSVFYLPMFLAVLLLCAILRRQWVEVERLMFPLARIPLEFTEGSARDGLLPDLFGNRAFLMGLLVSVGFRFLRAVPLFFDAERRWDLALPLAGIFSGTPFELMNFHDITLNFTAIGFGYLVPADVSLSVWFFFLFSRVELRVAHSLNITSAQGGTYSKLMKWQQLGSNLVFVIGMFYVARRHLWTVLKKALFLSRTDEDASEPVSYFWAFWGFLLAMAFCIGWHMYYDVPLWVAAYGMALLFCWFLAYARVTAQGGLYIARPMWWIQETIHSTTGALTGSGAVLMTAHENMLMYGSNIMLMPVAMDVFRISDAIGRRKRLLVPAIMCGFVVAIVVTSYMFLKMAYGVGAVNFAYSWATMNVPRYVFDWSHAIIKQPRQQMHFYPGSFAFGFLLTGFIMLMRGRFYWWPIHPIGLLACNSYAAQRIWVPFFLGWLIKTLLMKFSGGQKLRTVRVFFIAYIVSEITLGGLSTAVRMISGGAVPEF
ncbi:MAG: hypothetical protein GXY85_01510 [Candidatus Brocadiaceae bacterium]|nr:hypothetical protein [Candidatus Brocadiaceae bacterium]